MMDELGDLWSGLIGGAWGQQAYQSQSYFGGQSLQNVHQDFIDASVLALTISICLGPFCKEVVNRNVSFCCFDCEQWCRAFPNWKEVKI